MGKKIEKVKELSKEYSGANFAISVIDKAKNEGEDLVSSVKEMASNKKGKYYSEEKREFSHWYDVYNFNAKDCSFVYKYSCVYAYILLVLTIMTIAYSFTLTSIVGLSASFSSILILGSAYIKFASRAYVIRKQDTFHPFGFLCSIDNIVPNYWYYKDVEIDLKNKFGR
ncbi:hypothetical protein [Buttiauxella gaviniae]|uniref:hypothetical protein n=1 Tax=Buttiauxella gaviniae TaxID=82990 RepID=UPI0039AF8B44